MRRVPQHTAARASLRGPYLLASQQVRRRGSPPERRTQGHPTAAWVCTESSWLTFSWWELLLSPQLVLWPQPRLPSLLPLLVRARRGLSPGRVLSCQPASILRTGVTLTSHSERTGSWRRGQPFCWPQGSPRLFGTRVRVGSAEPRKWTGSVRETQRTPAGEDPTRIPAFRVSNNSQWPGAGPGRDDLASGLPVVKMPPHIQPMPSLT